jgi:hypothetical protein
VERGRALVHRYAWNRAEKQRIAFLTGFYSLYGLAVLGSLLAAGAFSWAGAVGAVLLLAAALNWVVHARRDGEVLAEVNENGIRIGDDVALTPWTAIETVRCAEVRSTHNAPRYDIVVVGVDGMETRHRVDIVTWYAVMKAVERHRYGPRTVA